MKQRTNLTHCWNEPIYSVTLMLSTVLPLSCMPEAVACRSGGVKTHMEGKDTSVGKCLHTVTQTHTHTPLTQC